MEPGETGSSSYLRGKAAYPELTLAPGAFAAHLARCRARLSQPEVAQSELCVEDLFLACACLERLPRAAETFGRSYEKIVRGSIERLSTHAVFCDEVAQVLWEDLLVGRDGAAPKIGAYTGYGALARWVSVVAQRTALMMLRSDAAQARTRDAAALEAMVAAPNTEVAFAKARYRPLFEAALADALRSLSDRDRVVLHLHLLGGAGVEKMGKMYQVAPSSISRWLARIRETLAQDVRKRLSTTLHLAPEEFESLSALVMSQLDVSISRVLA